MRLSSRAWLVFLAGLPCGPERRGILVDATARAREAATGRPDLGAGEAGYPVGAHAGGQLGQLGAERSDLLLGKREPGGREPLAGRNRGLPARPLLLAQDPRRDLVADRGVVHAAEKDD